MVGSGELYAKPVAVLSASPRSSGGAYAREAIERTLRAQGATVVLSATVQVPYKRATTVERPDHQTVQAVSAALSALAAQVAATNSDDLHAQTT